MNRLPGRMSSFPVPGRIAACGIDPLPASQTYNGGNKVASDQATVAQEMQVIRQAIFQSPNGTIDSASICRGLWRVVSKNYAFR